MVDAAPWTRRWRQVVVNFDAKGVDKGSWAVVVAKGYSETSSINVLAKTSHHSRCGCQRCWIRPSCRRCSWRRCLCTCWRCQQSYVG
jgi:hypothetical protein